ncbi:hypothetical protein KBB60_01570 [Patescibacteria group bacterium]|nr:hypothetical protein [Patescibacteria group bacterium]
MEKKDKKGKAEDLKRVRAATSKHLARFRVELRQQIFKYVLAAIGLIAGLAWNDAIKSIIEYLFPYSAAGTVLVKLLYALIITLLIVMFSVYTASMLEAEEKKKPK